MGTLSKSFLELKFIFSNKQAFLTCVKAKNMLNSKSSIKTQILLFRIFDV